MPYINPFAQPLQALQNLGTIYGDIAKKRASEAAGAQQLAFKEKELAQRRQLAERKLEQPPSMRLRHAKADGKLIYYDTNTGRTYDSGMREIITETDPITRLKRGIYKDTGEYAWGEPRKQQIPDVSKVQPDVSKVPTETQPLETFDLSIYANKPIVDKAFITPEIVKTGAGMEAYLKNIVNNVAGWAMNTPIFPDEAIATNTIESFVTSIKPSLIAGFKGTNWQLQDVESWLPNAKKAWTDQKLEAEKLYGIYKKVSKLKREREEKLNNAFLSDKQRRLYNDSVNDLDVSLSHLPVNAYRFRESLENTSEQEITDYIDSLTPTQKLIFRDNVKKVYGE
jgi:hypothetical protein